MRMHIAHLDAERHCRIYWRWVTAANARMGTGYWPRTAGDLATLGLTQHC
jgi:hypothetical protein